MPDEFTVVAALLALAGVVGVVALRLRQPLITAFIGVGVIMGPVGLDWVQPGDDVELLAEVGIAVLLFLVGLKLDLNLLRTLGPAALVTGVSQVGVTAVLGFLLSLALGLDGVTALYVAIALTFSSTIIIVKLLSDKRELEQQHGRMALGILIVQDILVVLLMIVLTATGTAGDGNALTEFALIAGKGVALLVGLAVAIRFVLPRLLHMVARSAELLVLFSVAWAVALAALSDWMGFSTEVGAFLGGVALATTSYREAIGARLVSLRDFLLLFFFVELGASLDFNDAGSQIGRAIVLSLFVLLVKPLVILVVMGLQGYRRRTSFLTGLVGAQISEFSLILIALGFSLGQITSSTVGLVTLVGVITIGSSTYMILYSQRLYAWAAPRLGLFERSTTRPDDADTLAEPPEVVLYGLGRYGSMVARELCDAGVRFIAVESDPQMVTRWNDRAPATMTVVYGDAEDIEFVETLPLDSVRWVVSTIANTAVNLTLLKAMRLRGLNGRVALTAHTDAEANVLDAAGADVVLQPFTDAADHVLTILGHSPPLHDGPGEVWPVPRAPDPPQG
jgi:Kef-type K+ transport system membrane component KefB